MFRSIYQPCDLLFYEKHLGIIFLTKRPLTRFGPSIRWKIMCKIGGPYTYVGNYVVWEIVVLARLLLLAVDLKRIPDR